MKLYLSSYRIGNEAEELKKWIAKNNNKICIITNARDYSLDKTWTEQRLAIDIAQLEDVGFEVSILDLRKYFNNNNKALKNYLKNFNSVYVVGGNTFVLRQAMKLSGFDEYLKEKMEDSKFLYCGYSAGICVLAKDLQGLQIVDDPHSNPYGYCETIWEGLGILDYLPLPHFKSDHPESELIDEEVEYCIKNNIRYRTLQDGEVIIFNIMR